MVLRVEKCQEYLPDRGTVPGFTLARLFTCQSYLIGRTHGSLELGRSLFGIFHLFGVPPTFLFHAAECVHELHPAADHVGFEALVLLSGYAEGGLLASYLRTNEQMSPSSTYYTTVCMIHTGKACKRETATRQRDARGFAVKKHARREPRTPGDNFPCLYEIIVEKYSHSIHFLRNGVFI